ncbi:MAG: hypothetical protein ACQKBY_08350 [Verrucomicrobiales bacterium]
MKLLFSITTFFLLVSCTSQKQPIPQIPVVLYNEKPTSLPSQQREQLRHPETVKKYAIGRYIDPNNGLVMHEAHDIYRVEATSKWNRRPLRAASRITDLNNQSAFAQQKTELAQLRQSLQQERASSRFAIAANEKMRQQIVPLTKAVEHAQKLTKQNASLRQKLREILQSAPPSTDSKNETQISPDNTDSIKERLRQAFTPDKTSSL